MSLKSQETAVVEVEARCLAPESKLLNSGSLIAPCFYNPYAGRKFLFLVTTSLMVTSFSGVDSSTVDVNSHISQLCSSRPQEEITTLSKVTGCDCKEQTALLVTVWGKSLMTGKQART